MSEAAEVLRLRDSLIGNAETSAVWRARKAREFPWDSRNVESAKSLRRLNKALAELPPDSELWSRYAAIWGQAIEDDCPWAAEIEQEMLHSYGFSIHGASGSAEKFLSELLRALELESGSARSGRPGELRIGARELR